MLLVFNKLNKDIFEMLRSGKKRIETRAATAKYKKIEVGQDVEFSCDGQRFAKMVSKITHFDSIETLLKNYTPSDINPKLKTKEEIVGMYHTFPGYKEKIEKDGIIAIEFAKEDHKVTMLK